MRRYRDYSLFTWWLPVIDPFKSSMRSCLMTLCLLLVGLYLSWLLDVMRYSGWKSCNSKLTTNLREAESYMSLKKDIKHMSLCSSLHCTVSALCMYSLMIQKRGVVWIIFNHWSCFCFTPPMYSLPYCYLVCNTSVTQHRWSTETGIRQWIHCGALIRAFFLDAHLPFPLPKSHFHPHILFMSWPSCFLPLERVLKSWGGVTHVHLFHWV